MAKPKFEIYKDAKGEYRFRLKAPNGEIIATGESYSSKNACMERIQSVRKNVPIAETEEVKERILEAEEGLLIQEPRKSERICKKRSILEFKPFDWGEGTETVSEDIDKILYGD